MLTREPQRQRPTAIGVLGNIPVPGTRAGFVISLGLVALAWYAIPVARPFILGTGGLGTILGLLLWWKHDRQAPFASDVHSKRERKEK
jgi:hypothetical protein